MILFIYICEEKILNRSKKQGNGFSLRAVQKIPTNGVYGKFGVLKMVFIIVVVIWLKVLR